MDTTLAIIIIAVVLYLLYFIIHLRSHSVAFRKEKKIGCWAFDVVVGLVFLICALSILFARPQ